MTNFLYDRWPILGFTVPVAVAATSAFFYLLRNPVGLERWVLEIKQTAASLFLQTVVDEARYLLDEVDALLPSALVAKPLTRLRDKTRFDYLCDELRKLSEDSQDGLTQRERYEGLVRDALVGLLKDQVHRILTTAIRDNQGFRADTIGGEAALRFRLSGDAQSRLNFLSLTLSKTRRAANICRAAFWLLIVSLGFLALSCFVFSVPSVLLNNEYGTYASIALAGGTVLSMTVVFVTGLTFGLKVRGLHLKAKRYAEAQALDDEFARWRNQLKPNGN